MGLSAVSGRLRYQAIPRRFSTVSDANIPVTADQRGKRVVDCHARRSWSSLASTIACVPSSVVLRLYSSDRAQHGKLRRRLIVDD